MGLPFLGKVAPKCSAHCLAAVAPLVVLDYLRERMHIHCSIHHLIVYRGQGLRVRESVQVPTGSSLYGRPQASAEESTTRTEPASIGAAPEATPSPAAAAANSPLPAPEAPAVAPT